MVGVQFRRAGKVYDFSSDGIEVSVGDFVVVNSERGPSLAEVVAIRFLHPDNKIEKKLKPIVRRASLKELGRPARLTPEAVQSFTRQQVEKHGLKMKILHSEVQFGGNKVIVYFSSPGRVDFRELVKDLAGGLKTRIELKQIGARDETKLLGGTGICGREYCCSGFLREFVPVSIRMAKNQNLALNPNKVSGGCGRLLCCLTYENKTYSDLRTRLPPRGARVTVRSTGLTGVVIKSDLLNQIVVLEREQGESIEARVSDLEISTRTLKPTGTIATEGENGLSQEDADAMEWAEGLDLSALSEDFAPRQSSQEKDRSPKKTRPDTVPYNHSRPGRTGRGKELFNPESKNRQSGKSRKGMGRGRQQSSRPPRAPFPEQPVSPTPTEGRSSGAQGKKQIKQQPGRKPGVSE